jgi:hypothetical protein
MDTVPYLPRDTMASAAGITGIVAQRLGFGALGLLALRPQCDQNWNMARPASM